MFEEDEENLEEDEEEETIPFPDEVPEEYEEAMEEGYVPPEAEVSLIAKRKKIETKLQRQKRNLEAKQKLRDLKSEVRGLQVQSMKSSLDPVIRPAKKTAKGFMKMGKALQQAGERSGGGQQKERMFEFGSSNLDFGSKQSGNKFDWGQKSKSFNFGGSGLDATSVLGSRSKPRKKRKGKKKGGKK